MNESRSIPLTFGQFAIVDAEDYEWMSRYKWRAQWSKKIQSFYDVRSGNKAWGECSTVLMLREILGLHLGDARKGDHKNPAHTLDNRRSNLRIATSSQNAMNNRQSRASRSPFKGITFDERRKKWRSSIWVDGKGISLGSFSDPHSAHEAYCNAAKKHYGEFARFA